MYHRDGYSIATIVVILTALSAMTFLQNDSEVRCIWCETRRNCCGEKREGQSANDYLLIIILILISHYSTWEALANKFVNFGCTVFIKWRHRHQ